MDLGANEWTTFWKVTFPLILPGVIAAALLAFSLSIDDYVITDFTSGRTTPSRSTSTRASARHPGPGQRDRHDHLPGRRRARALSTVLAVAPPARRDEADRPARDPRPRR